MGLTLDNQTLLYIILGLFIIQIFVIRYYVQSTVESRIQSNNKKVTKSFTGCIDTTFDKYIGPFSPQKEKNYQNNQNNQNNKKIKQRIVRNEGVDSIEDPADNESHNKKGQDQDQDQDQEQEQENENDRDVKEYQNEDQNEDQEECVTNDD